jgi:hypothetical protein
MSGANLSSKTKRKYPVTSVEHKVTKLNSKLCSKSLYLQLSNESCKLNDAQSSKKRKKYQGKVLLTTLLLKWKNKLYKLLISKHRKFKRKVVKV